MNPTKLAQLQKQANNVRTGGKGSVRRKKKVVRKTQVTNDKRLQQTIKRLGGQQVREADEVLFYKEDGSVTVVRQAKLQAAVSSNAFVVSGIVENKQASEVGGNDLDLSALMKNLGAGGAGAGAGDDDIPDLVDSKVNFEEVATGKQ